MPSSLYNHKIPLFLESLISEPSMVKVLPEDVCPLTKLKNNYKKRKIKKSHVYYDLKL